MRRGRLAAGGLVASVFCCSFCSSPAPAQGIGGPCSLVSDCKTPLVCIAQPDGSRRCSNDTSSIVRTEDAAPTAEAGPASSTATGAGSADGGGD